MYAIKLDAIPKLLFNTAVENLVKFGHIRRRLAQNSRYFFKRILGTVLGEAMAIMLALVLFGIASTLTELLDSKTCWELFPILLGFLEVEVGAFLSSCCVGWGKYTLLEIYGQDSASLGLSPEAVRETRERMPSFGRHNPEDTQIIIERILAPPSPLLKGVQARASQAAAQPLPAAAGPSPGGKRE